jgi:hypothetical protein
MLPMPFDPSIVACWLSERPRATVILIEADADRRPLMSASMVYRPCQPHAERHDLRSDVRPRCRKIVVASLLFVCFISARARNFRGPFSCGEGVARGCHPY